MLCRGEKSCQQAQLSGADVTCHGWLDCMDSISDSTGNTVYNAGLSGLRATINSPTPYVEPSGYYKYFVKFWIFMDL